MIEASPSSAESKDTNDDSSESNSSDSKSSRSSRNRRIGTFVAKNVEAPNIHRVPGAEPEKSSLWRELIKAPAEKKGENEKPEAAPWGVQNNVETTQAELAAAANRREAEESDENEEEAPIEGIGRKKEKREVARRIADASESEAIEALVETPETASKDTKATAEAEASASVALMKTFKEKMADNPDADVEEILDESTDEIIEKIKGDSEPTTQVVANEGELPLHEAAPDDDDGTVVIPLSASSSGSGSGGSNSGSGGSNSGGGSNGSNGPGGPGTNGPSGPGPGPGGPGGPGGNTPPPGPGNPNVPPPGPGNPNIPPVPPVPPYASPYGPPFPGPNGPNFNALPAMPPGISLEDHEAIVNRRERIALAQGLLVGGIIGYLIGRRRGRIKTEKRLLPIQEKLEKQVEGLQSAILTKEQTVRRMAAERANELATQEEKEKFMRRLARAEDIRAKAETARRERLAAKEATVQEVRSEQLGRMLVEAPTAVVAGVAGAGRPETGVQASRSEVDFSKKVEDYTEPELRLAAEKIRIDGTTLKELWDGGRLNERSVKRVMQEFIEGRSVRAALTKELMERDLRIEKDPHLRDAMVAQHGGGSGGAAVKTATAAAGADMLLKNMESPQNADQAAQTASNSQWQIPEKLSPQQKKTLLDKVKEDPKVQVAGVVAFTLILIAAALIFA